MRRLLSTALGLILGVATLPAETPSESAGSTAEAILQERFALHEAALPEGLCLEVPFRETRSFPFRRDNRHLTGRILRERTDEGRFAFIYEVPVQLRLLYAEDTLRLARGSRDPVPLETSEATIQIFASIFNKDIPAITRAWTVALEQEAGGQSQVIVLTPKIATHAEAYNRIQLIFEDDLLKTVRVHRRNHVEHRYDLGTAAALDCDALASQF